MAYIKEKSRLDFNMNVISGGVKNCFQRNIKNVMNYWIAVFEKGIIVKPIVLLLILEWYGDKNTMWIKSTGCIAVERNYSQYMVMGKKKTDIWVFISENINNEYSG